VPTLKLIEDFLNTVDERTFSRHGETHVAREHLTSPQVLSDWLAAHDLPTAEVELQPGDLTATVALRTALRRALLGEPGTTAALTDHHLQLVPDQSRGLRIAARSGRPWLDTIVETVAQSAAQGDWQRIKLCAAPDCHWAFYDTSRSGRGRWCSMDICGNRHKTRTYRERRRRTR
jgi:predicted RNA-binding Zn ribbon-like protein